MFSQESMKLVKQRYDPTSTKVHACASECLATTPTPYTPSTMLQEMPCGKEKIVVYPYPSEAVAEFENRLKTKQWFGLAEVDISVPNELWDKF